MAAQTPDLGKYANVVRLNANVLAEGTKSYGGIVLERLYKNARRMLGPGAATADGGFVAAGQSDRSWLLLKFDAAGLMAQLGGPGAGQPTVKAR